MSANRESLDALNNAGYDLQSAAEHELAKAFPSFVCRELLEESVLAWPKMAESAFLLPYEEARVTLVAAGNKMFIFLVEAVLNDEIGFNDVLKFSLERWFRSLNHDEQDHLLEVTLFLGE